MRMKPTMMGWPFWLALSAMILIVVVSNYAVLQPFMGLEALFGLLDEDGNPSFTFNYGQFTFPLAFLITDIVNRLFGAQFARLIAFIALVPAVASSILINGWLPFPGDQSPWETAIWVGVASGTAFILGQLLDITVFQRLRQQAWWVAPFVGSVIASAIDTSTFYAIAFCAKDWVLSAEYVDSVRKVTVVLTAPDWVLRAGLVDFAVKFTVAVVALVPFRLVIAASLSNRSATGAN